MANPEGLRQTVNGGPRTFLVEMRAPRLATAEVAGMHWALQLAVARLGATGAAISWLSGILVPNEPRCLWFLTAVEEAHVARARDAAGLPTAAVHLVHKLSDGQVPRSSRPPRPPIRER